MSKTGLIAGFDLSNEYSQISYFDVEKNVPVCIGKDEDEQFIPTVLGIKDTGEWLYGNDALSYYEQGRCSLVKDFVKNICKGRTIECEGNEIDHQKLLVVFFEKTIFKLKEYEPVKPIEKLVVTTPILTQAFSECIYSALSELGIDKSKVEIINYKQSYLYYVLSHSGDIWVNDVGMFDFTKDGLYYYQLSVDRHRTPMIAGVSKKDFSDVMNYSMLSDDKYKDSLGYLFENVAQTALRRQIVSTLYLIGDGFLGGWATLTMKKLCGNRRVFAGRNLYVLGACFAGRKLLGQGTMKDFVMIDDDMLSSHVSLSVYVNANSQDVILAKAGSVWYEVDNSIDIIPDGESELAINVTNVLTREVSKHLLSLETLGINNYDRMNRINIRVRFESVNRCIVTIADKGFGEFLPNSHRISERIFEV